MSWRLPPLWMVQPVMFNVIVKQDYKNLKRIICILSFYQVVKFHYPLTFFLLIQNIHCWPFCLLLTPTQFSASSCSRPSWHCDRASPQCSGPRTSGFQKTKHRSWTSVITSRPVLHQGKESAIFNKSHMLVNSLWKRASGAVHFIGNFSLVTLILGLGGKARPKSAT